MREIDHPTGHATHFFDKNYDKGMEWYIDQMPIAMENQLITEKTPGYFHTEGVPQRIKNMDPSIKLLLILRLVERKVEF